MHRKINPEIVLSRFTPIVALLPIVLASPVVAQESPPADSSAVMFTTDQANRGEKAFQRDCAACHGTTEFKGAFFLNRWSTGTAYQLFDFLRTQMPIDNPGKLDPEEYVAIVTYLLRLNDYPAGKREMPADPAALRAITLTRDTTTSES